MEQIICVLDDGFRCALIEKVSDKVGRGLAIKSGATEGDGNFLAPTVRMQVYVWRQLSAAHTIYIPLARIHPINPHTHV